jgi:hypothetical protein
MKYILPLLLLTGCGGNVTSYELDSAIKQCGGVEHIYSIDIDMAFNANVRCDDGSFHYHTERTEK